MVIRSLILSSQTRTFLMYNNSNADSPVVLRKALDTVARAEVDVLVKNRIVIELYSTDINAVARPDINTAAKDHCKVVAGTGLVERYTANIPCRSDPLVRDTGHDV